MRIPQVTPNVGINRKLARGHPQDVVRRPAKTLQEILQLPLGPARLEVLDDVMDFGVGEHAKRINADQIVRIYPHTQQIDGNKSVSGTVICLTSDTPAMHPMDQCSNDCPA